MKSPSKRPACTLGALIRLRPEEEERYCILHRHVFPGVLDRIRRSRIQNYTIFLRDGVLFSHMEYAGRDLKADMASMANPVTLDWWKLTDPMQQPLQSRKPGEWWASVKPVIVAEGDAGRRGPEHILRRAFLRRAESSPVRPGRVRSWLRRAEFCTTLGNDHIRSLIVYAGHSFYCLYTEQSGSQLRPPSSTLIRQLDKLLGVLCGKKVPGRWQEMREVFHTDGKGRG